MNSPQPSPDNIATTLNTLDAQSAEIVENLKLMHNIYTATQTSKGRNELCFMYYELTSGLMIDTLIKRQDSVNQVSVEGSMAMCKAEGINEGIEKEEVRLIIICLREKFVELNMEVDNITQWIEKGAEQ
jgi:predicted hydrolase (HD superfamily)